jgi:hypothetical protein
VGADRIADDAQAVAPSGQFSYHQTGVGAHHPAALSTTPQMGQLFRQGANLLRWSVGQNPASPYFLLGSFDQGLLCPPPIGQEALS